MRGGLGSRAFGADIGERALVAQQPAIETRMRVPFLIYLGLGYVTAAVGVLAVVATTRPYHARYWLFIGLAVFSIGLFGWGTTRYIHRCARDVRVASNGIWVETWSRTEFSATWPEIEWVRLTNSAQRAGVPVILWLNRRDGKKFALPISRGRLLPVHKRVLAEAR